MNASRLVSFLMSLLCFSLGANAGVFTPEEILPMVENRLDCPAPWSYQNGQGCFQTAFDFAAKGRPSATSTDGVVIVRSAFLSPDRGSQEKGSLLLFGGIGDTFLAHTPFLKQLAYRGWRIVAFDFPGQGGSTGTLKDISFNRMQEVASLVWSRYALPTKGQRKPWVIGWDVGGSIAFNGLVRGTYEKAVLLNPLLLPRIPLGWSSGEEFSFMNIRTDEWYAGVTNTPESFPNGVYSPTVKSYADAFSVLFEAYGEGFRLLRKSVPKKAEAIVFLSETSIFHYPTLTQKLLNSRAPHFQVETVPGKNHMISVSDPLVLKDMADKADRFLSKGLPKY